MVLVGKCGKWKIMQTGKNPASKNTVNRGTVYTGFPTVSGKKKFRKKGVIFFVPKRKYDILILTRCLILLHSSEIYVFWY